MAEDDLQMSEGLRLWQRRVRRKRLKRALAAPFEWLGIAAALSLIIWLPWRLLRLFCDFLSCAMYRLDRRGKRRALEILHVVRGTCTGVEGTDRFDPDSGPYCPTCAEERIIRRSYRNMARTVGYAFWTLVRARARCAQVGEMAPSGKAFLSANRPAVTVSGHIGCWEILSQLAFLEGHQMMSVAKDIGTRGMTKLLMSARRSIGQEIVSADGAFKPLMAGIKAGKSLGLLVDQKVSPDKGGVWIRFFGRPIPVSAAPAFFAAKAKAPIAVAWSRPLKDGRYRCEVVDTISPEAAKDIWATTQRCAHALEKVIRRHPSCWVLNYNYFREPITPEVVQALEARETKGAKKWH